MKQRKGRLGAQDLLGAAGAAPKVTWKGKSWTVGFNVQAAKSALEELIRQHVVRDMIRTKTLLGGTDGQSYYDEKDAKLDRGHYKTLRPGWWGVIQDADAGTPLLVLSLMQASHPDLTLADVRQLAADEPEQLGLALKVAAPGFFRHAAEAARASPEEVRRVETLVREAFGATTSTPSNGSSGC